MLPRKKSSRSKQVEAPAPPPRPASQPPVPSKGIVKEDLVNTIIKYQTNPRFGNIVTKELGIKYTRNQLSKYTIDNLESILHRIRTHLNTRNMDQVFEHMAKVVANGYEDLITNFGYNIEGFSDLLFANPAWHDAYARWQIERKIPDIPPSLQLVYIIASTTYIAHLHSPQASVKEIKQQPPKKKIVTQKKEKDHDQVDQRLKSKNKPGDIII